MLRGVVRPCVCPEHAGRIAAGLHQLAPDAHFSVADPGEAAADDIDLGLGDTAGVAQRYKLLYRLGITPWEHDEAPEQLKDLVEASAMPLGRALDVGCGSGGDAVYLAEHGWTVTAVDGVAQPLSAARERARAAGVEVNWVQGDVCQLEQLELGGAFGFVLDRGCFHDFTDDQRDQYARGVSAVTSADAVLLMFAFQPRRRGLGPRGVSEEELTRHFGRDWELLSSAQDTGVRLPRWLGDARPTWHRFKRRV